VSAAPVLIGTARGGTLRGMSVGDTESDVLPVIALRNVVVFPGVAAGLRVGRPKSVAALVQARRREGRLLLVAQRRAEEDEPGPGGLYEVGVAARVVRASEGSPRGVYDVLVEGLARCRILECVQRDPYMAVRVEALPDTGGAAPAELRRRVHRLHASGPGAEGVDGRAEAANLDYVAAFALKLPVADKQALLEERDALTRYRMLLPVLEAERRVRDASERLRREGRHALTEEERRRYLVDRRQEVEDELARLTGGGDGLVELRRRVEQAGLPDEVRAEADRELDRLSRTPPVSPEFAVATDHLEWLADLPWSRSVGAEIDLERARAILDRDHYGRENLKERVIEHLSVLRLRPESQGAVLCLVGAPGTGKTSMGRSIAEATGRAFGRVALGGMRDEAQIRGHRRTYIGALPGRIIRALRDAGARNPVLMLDEVDKLQTGWAGDPVSALLEVLDPEQNTAFVDNYLGVPFDLSDVMFVATGNTTRTVPGVLLDRLEVIELPGYWVEEKIAIARCHLVPKQLLATGLGVGSVEFADGALELLAEGYTRESGVRSLERKIASVCRKIARERVGTSGYRDYVDAPRLKTRLGPPDWRGGRGVRPGGPGVCPTLSVSPTGGSVVFVEVSCASGTGRLRVTGRAGQVLQEAARLALSYWLSRPQEVGMESEQMAGLDFHVHLSGPDAPADGAWAGLPIALAMACCLLSVTVPDGTAVCGEITLRGHVRTVDRVAERLAAAQRAGCRTVVLPEQCRAEVETASRTRGLQGLSVWYVRSVAEGLSLVMPGAVVGTGPAARGGLGDANRVT
jgi:ATP-dependent Lon protease